MLFEKTTYLDNFPLNIRIASITEYPFHYHQDVEFIYVLKGEVHLKNVGQHYTLKEGDIFTNSGHEVHSLTATDKDNVVAVIQVSNRFFTQYFPALGKACFMSYVENDKSDNLHELRTMLLHILLDYTRRSFNYKNNCIDKMIDVIKYMNLHFNLFAFEDRVVVNFQNDNPVVVERISRIINYVYEHHASRITLEDLAEREHLSTFYISHLIRNYMGINFQEFLCFARAEMSEILLLETDAKVSVIAKDVGFSTTSYYEKFFKKWFGHTPSAYRTLYQSHILSNSRPARYEPLSENQAVSLIRQCLSAESDQEKSASVIDKLHLTVEVNEDTAPLREIHPDLEVVITPEDYQVMGEQLFSALHELNATRVIIAYRADDNESAVSLIENRLCFSGYQVSKVCDNGLSSGFSAGNDSIAAAVHLFGTYFQSKENRLHCRLRDQGSPSRMLKGEPACITSCMVPKPAFYAYRLLKNFKGKLLCCEKQFAVLKNDFPQHNSYTIVVVNGNEDIFSLSSRSAGVHEANDIINSFKDELNIDFTIPVEPGQYIVAKYVLSKANSIFTHMAHLGFPNDCPIPQGWMHMLNTQPSTQVNVREVAEELSISSMIKGAGVHVILVKKIE